jgi:hypothetical protein
MADLLTGAPELVQVALLRHPWNPAEIAAGGIVEQHPADYVDRLAIPWDRPIRYLEHRRFFTTNPSLYRMDLVRDTEWPDGTESEGRYGIGLLSQDPARQFAFFGARGDGPAVEHIGAARVGTGY